MLLHKPPPLQSSLKWDGYVVIKVYSTLPAKGSEGMAFATAILKEKITPNF